jgi:hypothetical protein
MERGEIPKDTGIFGKIGKVLPCPKCKKHFEKYIKKHPINNKSNVVDWVFDYHNDVNKVTKSRSISKEDMYNIYTRDDKVDMSHHKVGELLLILHQYHSEEKSLDKFRKFINLLEPVMPCEKCRDRLKKYKGKGTLTQIMNCKD